MINELKYTDDSITLYGRLVDYDAVSNILQTTTAFKNNKLTIKVLKNGFQFNKEDIFVSLIKVKGYNVMRLNTYRIYKRDKSKYTFNNFLVDIHNELEKQNIFLSKEIHEVPNDEYHKRKIGYKHEKPEEHLPYEGNKVVFFGQLDDYKKIENIVLELNVFKTNKRRVVQHQNGFHYEKEGIRVAISKMANDKVRLMITRHLDHSKYKSLYVLNKFVEALMKEIEKEKIVLKEDIQK